MNPQPPTHQLGIRCRCDVELVPVILRGLRGLKRVHADHCPLGAFIATHDTRAPSGKNQPTVKR